MTRWIAGLSLILVFLIGCDENVENDSDKVYGVIEYKIDSLGTLHGQWTSLELEGQIGTENATPRTPGQIEGMYDVKIYSPSDSLIYQGTLNIGTQGDVYTLAWRSSSDQGAYDGLGVMAGSDRLAAYFYQE